MSESNLVKKIKILYVIDSSKVGGAENYIANLMRYLDKNRFDPILVCSDNGEMLDVYKKSASRVYTLNTTTFFSLKAVSQIGDIIKKEDIDIVHSLLFTSDFCACLAAKLRNRIFISTIVGFNFLPSITRGLGRFKRELQSLVYRSVYFFANRLIAISEVVKIDLSLRKGIKARNCKIEKIYCGIPEIKLNGSQEEKYKYTQDLEDKIIITVASLIDVKGHTYLLKSAPQILRSFPKVKFLLVGEGPKRTALEKEAKDLGIEKNIIFAGYLNDEDKNLALGLSDIVVLPSLSEGGSILALEAMSLKKPVVVTNVGAIPELVVDGKTGILVEPRDHEGLAEAIVKLLSKVDLANQMGEEGQKLFHANFSVERMVDSTSKVYIGLLRAKKE